MSGIRMKDEELEIDKAGKCPVWVHGNRVSWSVLETATCDENGSLHLRFTKKEEKQREGEGGS